jgi:hypothetical protein
MLWGNTRPSTSRQDSLSVSVSFTADDAPQARLKRIEKEINLVKTMN